MLLMEFCLWLWTWCPFSVKCNLIMDWTVSDCKSGATPLLCFASRSQSFFLRLNIFWWMVWVSLRALQLPLTVQRNTVSGFRLTGYSKFPIGVNLYVHVLAPRQAGELTRVYPISLERWIGCTAKTCNFFPFLLLKYKNGKENTVW